MVLVGGLFRVSGLVGWFWSVACLGSAGWWDGSGQGVGVMVGVRGLMRWLGSAGWFDCWGQRVGLGLLVPV